MVLKVWLSHEINGAFRYANTAFWGQSENVLYSSMLTDEM